ncbi:hypothetical protein N9948_01650 [bacterium]|nr:hypothetical protein [bacterium]
MGELESDYFYLISMRKVTETVEEEIIGYSPRLPKVGDSFTVIHKSKKEGCINLFRTSPVKNILHFIEKPNYKTVKTEKVSYDLWVLEEKIPQIEVEDFIKEIFIKTSPEVDMIMSNLDRIKPKCIN